MDPVHFTIVGVAVALAALIVTLNGSLRRDIDKRFDGVDKRFDGVDKRFDGIEERFDKRFDGIEERFGKRIDGIEERFDKRIDGIEERFDKRFDGTDRRLDGFDGRLRSVEQGLAEVLGKLTFVESYILGRNDPAPGETPAE